MCVLQMGHRRPFKPELVRTVPMHLVSNSWPQGIARATSEDLSSLKKVLVLDFL